VIPGLEARSMASKNSSGAHKLSALIRRRFGTQEFRGDSPVALRFLAHTRRNTSCTGLPGLACVGSLALAPVGRCASLVAGAVRFRRLEDSRAAAKLRLQCSSRSTAFS
jgi:hypothetical protein